MDSSEQRLNSLLYGIANITPEQTQLITYIEKYVQIYKDIIIQYWLNEDYETIYSVLTRSKTKPFSYLWLIKAMNPENYTPESLDILNPIMKVVCDKSYILNFIEVFSILMTNDVKLLYNLNTTDVDTTLIWKSPVYMQMIEKHLKQTVSNMHKIVERIPITALQRQTSICTNQGAEGTCYAHALSKIYLQNIYLYVLPIKVTNIEWFHSCFDVLRTDIDHDFNSKISLAKCGIGYYKILLFLYLYWLNKAPEDKGPFPDNFNNLISTVTAMDEIPKLFTGQNKIQFEKIKETITRKIKQRHVMWDVFIIDFDMVTEIFIRDILSPILNLGLYVELSISGDQQGHAVIITSYNGVEFGIVNSWGDDITITNNITKITLNGKIFFTSHCKFILPFYADTPRLPKYMVTNDLIKYFKGDLPPLVKWSSDYADNIRKHKLTENQSESNGGTRKYCKRSNKNKRSKSRKY